MVLLDACTEFCSTLSTAFGPLITEVFAFVGLIALGWWKARKVQASATAGIAAANEQASKAKVEARAAQLQIARIEGSLRPSALTPMPPTLGSSSSTSGNFEPVTMPEIVGAPKPRPAMPDPSLTDPTFPRPSALPALDVADEDTVRTNPPKRK